MEKNDTSSQPRFSTARLNKLGRLSIGDAQIKYIQMEVARRCMEIAKEMKADSAAEKIREEFGIEK